MLSGEFDDTIVEVTRGIAEGLPDIFLVEFWKLVAQLGAIRIGCHQLHNPAYSQA